MNNDRYCILYYDYIVLWLHYLPVTAQEATRTLEIHSVIPSHEVADFPVSIIVGRNQSLSDKVHIFGGGFTDCMHPWGWLRCQGFCRCWKRHEERNLELEPMRRREKTRVRSFSASLIIIIILLLWDVYNTCYRSKVPSYLSIIHTA